MEQMKTYINLKNCSEKINNIRHMELKHSRKIEGRAKEGCINNQGSSTTHKRSRRSNAGDAIYMARTHIQVEWEKQYQHQQFI